MAGRPETTGTGKTGPRPLRPDQDGAAAPSPVADGTATAVPTQALGPAEATPVADQQALAETMRAAGAEVDAVVYDGAPHSFFDRAFGDWAEACQDAWEHVLALTDRVALA